MWKYEVLMSVPIFSLSISLLFILMMIRNIETGFESTLDVYQTLNIASIVFVISLPVIPLVWLRYRTLYTEPPNIITKLYVTGQRVKKSCTVCNRHPVSRGYHLKHVHQLENAKIRDYFKDCGCERCQNLEAQIGQIYYFFEKYR